MSGFFWMWSWRENRESKYCKGTRKGSGGVTAILTDAVNRYTGCDPFLNVSDHAGRDFGVGGGIEAVDRYVSLRKGQRGCEGGKRTYSH